MSGKKIVLVGDMGLDHEGFPPTPVVEGSPDVFVDGKPVARVGDALAPHSKPKHPPHPRIIASGSTTVLINGVPAAITGGTISCGGFTMGSGTVVIGDTHTPHPISPPTPFPARNPAAVDPDDPDDSPVSSAGTAGASSVAGAQGGNGQPAPAAPKNTFAGGGFSDESADDSPAEKEPTKVRVEAGFFFDGTGNNRNNTQTYQKQMDECLTANSVGLMSDDECSRELSQMLEGSYLNAETNVSKLENLYQRAGAEGENGEKIYRLSTYVSGVGTKSGKPDDGMSMGLGLGEQGMLKKIEEGIEDFSFRLKRAVNEQIDELVLDVFGFSRGAATARHFVSREVFDTTGSLYSERKGALAKAFSRQGIPVPKTITVRFLGIFDTVAAVADLNNLDFSAHDANNGRINVHVKPEQVQKAVHFVARDERRHNFSLNSLRDESGNLPPNFGEWVLPGAHSDIGGGYQDWMKERIEVRPPLLVKGQDRRNPEASFEFSRMLDERSLIMDEGWLGPKNPGATLEVEQERPRGMPGGDVTLRLWLEREVRGEYSRIPLYLMHKLAVDAGVPLDVIDPEDASVSLPQALFATAQDLASHVWYGNELLVTPQSKALLQQRYLHHSAHYLKLGPLYPFQPAKYGRRVIHLNKGL